MLRAFLLVTITSSVCALVPGAAAARVVARSTQGYYDVSADGRYLVNMRAVGSTSGPYRLELYDTQTGTTRLIARNSGLGFISQDGRVIIYSQARRSAHPFGVILRSYSVSTGRSRTIDSSGRLNLLGLDPSGHFAAVEKFPTHVHRNVGVLNLRTKRFRRFPLPPSGFHNIGPVALSQAGKHAVLWIHNKFGEQNVLVRAGIHRDLQTGLNGSESGGAGAISADGSVSMVNIFGGGIALIAPDLTRLAILPNAQGNSQGFPTGSITQDGQTALQACGSVLALYSLATHTYSRIEIPTVNSSTPVISGSGNRAFVISDGPLNGTILMFDTATATPVGNRPPDECVPTPPS